MNNILNTAERFADSLILRLRRVATSTAQAMDCPLELGFKQKTAGRTSTAGATEGFHKACQRRHQWMVYFVRLSSQVPAESSRYGNIQPRIHDPKGGSDPLDQQAVASWSLDGLQASLVFPWRVGVGVGVVCRDHHCAPRALQSVQAEITSCLVSPDNFQFQVAEQNCTPPTGLCDGGCRVTLPFLDGHFSAMTSRHPACVHRGCNPSKLPAISGHVENCEHLESCGANEPWWKTACIYQVYPASFKDSNGDGWGDIQGVISKIDYLANLGVDCIWLSPCFDSPMEDMGYDVSDYQKIYAPYGTIDDIDELIGVCHAHGMKLVLDLVVNHTSLAHPWFQESRSSRTSPKRDWYIWRPPRYSTTTGERLPPTNWRSYFAGSTWTFDEATQEYYLHLYAPSQPDLNWDNPDVRRAIYEDTMHFWLRRGIDGFRIDTVNKYSKDTRFLDAPITDAASYHQPAPEMWCNGPNIHTYLREMHQEALAPYDAVSIGELSNCPDPTTDVLPYVRGSDPQQSMCFQFDLIRLGTGAGGFGDKYIYTPFSLDTLKQLTSKWQTFLDGTDGWTTVFCENHDNGRAVSRFGDTSTRQRWEASAKCLAVWQATLTGTLFLYQGQEIGMRNMPSDWGIESYKDVESNGFYDEAVRSGDTERVRLTMEGLRILARDHARTPMQWDGTASYADFTVQKPETEPWMRVNTDDLEAVNVASQQGTEGSVLEFWRRMLRIRKEHSDVFVFGKFRLQDTIIGGGREGEGKVEGKGEGAGNDDKVFAYTKESQDGEALAVVVMNFSSQEVEYRTDKLLLQLSATSSDATEGSGSGSEHSTKLDLLVATPDMAGAREGVLRPWEARVYLSRQR